MKEMLKKENEIVLLIFLILGIMTCSGLSLSWQNKCWLSCEYQ